MDFRWAYKSAAASFSDLVHRLPPDGWDGAGLGEWSLRDLVGHTTSSALRQVPVVLGSPGSGVAVDSPEGYWAFARSAPPELVAAARAASTDDARSTGVSLGDDPSAVVTDHAREATRVLSTVGDADVIATPVGGMRVRDWIPTRTFELVVHGLDVAAAARIPVEYAAEVVAEVTMQAARVAATGGDATLVLRALTGRASLATGFSVV